MLTDIEIAQAATPQPISAIAQKAGVPEQYLEQYGTTKAKVDYNLLRDEQHTPGKLVLVTAINPTPAGEGKTTTTVGLADALQKRGTLSASGVTKAWYRAARPRPPAQAGP